MICPDVIKFLNFQDGRKLALLDRDGTINVDHGYVFKPDFFKFNDNFRKVIPFLNNKNLVIVSNQSGVSRGYFTENDSRNFTRLVVENLKKENVHINYALSCFHSTECQFRKPNPGMLEYAIKLQNWKTQKVIFIGNSNEDSNAANSLDDVKFLNINQIDLISMLQKEAQ
jgi:HAD superfamily hydrolase (TIGR01662 family)